MFDSFVSNMHGSMDTAIVERFTLVVIGGTVSKISGTLAELRAMNFGSLHRAEGRGIPEFGLYYIHHIRSPLKIN